MSIVVKYSLIPPVRVLQAMLTGVESLPFGMQLLILQLHLSFRSTSSLPKSPVDTHLCFGVNFLCAVWLMQDSLCSLMPSDSPQDSSNNHNKLLSWKAPRE